MIEGHHTPGRWRATIGNMVRVYVAETGKSICCVHKNRPLPEVIANAYLIEAAPAMLKVLESSIHHIVDHGKIELGTKESAAIIAIIKQARGDFTP